MKQSITTPIIISSFVVGALAGISASQTLAHADHHLDEPSVDDRPHRDSTETIDEDVYVECHDDGYRVKARRVIDGDTYVADIYLGLGVSLQEVIRVAGIDAPELRGEEKERGLEAREYAEEWLSPGGKYRWMTLSVAGRDKYGRIVGRTKRLFDEQSLAEAMVEAGHAREIKR